MDDWLSGVEHRPIPTVNGGSWAEDLPDRAVLHTTEGFSIEGALSTWANTKVPSHLVFDADQDRCVECLPLNVSAYALKNLPGGVETNRVGRTIQIEIVGRAADTPNWSKEKLHRIGKLLRRVKDEGGVDFQFVAPVFVGPEAGTIASSKAPQRMSQAAWRAFNGVCGHQHVPENDHWDPGHLDIVEVFNGAVIIAPPTIPLMEDDMNITHCRDKTGRQWFFGVADDKRLWAKFYPVGGGAPVGWYPVGGEWTSGVDFTCETSDDPNVNGLLVGTGRGRDGVAYQVRIYTDGGPKPPVVGQVVYYDNLGGHFYPPGQ